MQKILQLCAFDDSKPLWLRPGDTETDVTLLIQINWVKSKETVGNSWTVLKVILGHKYHESQSLNEVHIYR